MRFVFTLLLALGVATSAVTLPAVGLESGYVLAAEQQPGQIQVDIDANDAEWWANPIWIGLGVVALIALIAIIMAASRGGTTVVKD